MDEFYLVYNTDFNRRNFPELIGKYVVGKPEFAEAFRVKVVEMSLQYRLRREMVLLAHELNYLAGGILEGTNL